MKSSNKSISDVLKRLKEKFEIRNGDSLATQEVLHAALANVEYGQNISLRKAFSWSIFGLKKGVKLGSLEF